MIHLIDLQKRKLSEADEADKAAIQTEIDKFTELRTKKVNLKQDEYNEYIKILKEKNPQALKLVDVFNGELLSKEDKQAQDRLTSMELTYKGLDNITQSGTYKLYNTNSKAMEDVTVTVDKGTGIITGAYSEAIDQIGGYTKEMAADNAELGQSHSQLVIDCKKAMEDLTGAHVDASGQITNASGQIVSKLEEVKKAEDGTVEGIFNINGTPIEIQTNAEGTIS